MPPIPPIPPSPNALRLPALAAYRAASAVRRAEAFCDVPDFVLGTPCQPLTPRTFSMLYAVRSRFLFGGQPMEGDVRNYVWFHSPNYANCAAPDWAKRKVKVLGPLTRQLRVERWRRWFGLSISAEHYAAGLALACSEINQIFDCAFADAPGASGTPRAPLATMEASLIHQFASAYNWSPERTSNTPLRQLFQLDRCLAASRGHEVRDDGEDRILADHIRRRNEAIQAAKAEAEAVST